MYHIFNVLLYQDAINELFTQYTPCLVSLSNSYKSHVRVEMELNAKF